MARKYGYLVVSTGEERRRAARTIKTRERVTVVSNQRRKYGLMSFLFDVLMTAVTGGLWLIWVFVRETRG